MPLSARTAADVAIVFKPYRQTGNRSIYIGPDHDDISRQQIILASSDPKVTKDTYGNRRSSLNDIMTVEVATPNGESQRRDMKLETLASVPVGATIEEFKELIAHNISMLSNDTFVAELFLQGDIAH